MLRAVFDFLCSPALWRSGQLGAADEVIGQLLRRNYPVFIDVAKVYRSNRVVKELF